MLRLLFTILLITTDLDTAKAEDCIAISSINDKLLSSIGRIWHQPLVFLDGQWNTDTSCQLSLIDITTRDTLVAMMDATTLIDKIIGILRTVQKNS